ncbi:MAG TPA: hypothetical protein VK966_07620, partial [Longimicrobiales bacterium]|nr:hypothetical protein [Longimicrobiales bacterium]
APSLSAEVRRSSNDRWTVEGAGVPVSGPLSVLLSGTLVHGDRFLDGNGDGFSDMPMETQGTLFARAAGSRRIVG